MQLDIVKTSSTGNFFTLTNDIGKLLIECGLPMKEIKQHLNFELDVVTGCLLTHSHSDHSKSAKEIMGLGIDVYSSQSTFVELGIVDPTDRYKATHHRAFNVWHGMSFEVGGFKVLALKVDHDAPDPMCFIITDIKTKTNVLFATDMQFLRYKFKGIHHFIIECNYDEKTLSDNVENGLLIPPLAQRISETHMSLENLCDFFESCKKTSLRSVTLIHMSKNNLDSQLAVEKLSPIIGVVPTIASSGQTLNLL